MRVVFMVRWIQREPPNAGAEPPADDWASGKLSIRGTLIPVGSSELLGHAAIQSRPPGLFFVSRLPSHILIAATTSAIATRNSICPSRIQPSPIVISEQQ